MAADTGPNCVDTVTMEDSGSFTSADPQFDVGHPNETTPLIPEVNSSNRQRYVSSRCSFSVLYCLLLVAQVVALLSFFITDILLLSETNTTKSHQKSGRYALCVYKEITYAFSIFCDFIGTVNCSIFIAIIVKSPGFVGYLTVGRNLIHLPKFWTLVILLLLYLLGALLTIILYCTKEKESDDGLCKNCVACLKIIGIVIEVIHCCFITILIGFLNYTNIKNITRNGTNVLLKRALVVFCFCFAMYCLILVLDVGFILQGTSNLFVATGEFLLLPFCQKVIELLWKKIFHNDKCIIGKISSQNDENRHSSTV